MFQWWDTSWECGSGRVNTYTVTTTGVLAAPYMGSSWGGPDLTTLGIFTFTSGRSDMCEVTTTRGFPKTECISFGTVSDVSNAGCRFRVRRDAYVETLWFKMVNSDMVRPRRQPFRGATCAHT